MCLLLAHIGPGYCCVCVCTCVLKGLTKAYDGIISISFIIPLHRVYLFRNSNLTSSILYILSQHQYKYISKGIKPVWHTLLALFLSFFSLGEFDTISFFSAGGRVVEVPKSLHSQGTRVVKSDSCQLLSPV